MPLPWLRFELPTRLGAFYFAFFAYAAAYVAYFPLYLAGRGLDAAAIALVLALPQLARIFAPALWGWVADRAGARGGIVVASCASMAVCFAALPFVDAAGIAWLIGITGIVSAGALPLVEAIALGIPGGPARYGPIRLWGSVGFIAVVLGGGVWLDHFSPATVAPAMAVLAVAAVAAATGLPGGKRQANGTSLSVRLTPEARAVLGAGFCMAAAHGALYAFLTLHLQRLGYSGTTIGALWTLGVIAEILVFYYLPHLLRRYALSSILLFSFGCAVARFLGIAWLAGAFWLIALAQVLHAATFGSFHAASVAAIHRVFPDTAHARGQALFSSASYGAGGAIGAMMAGWAWDAHGAGLAFTGAALFGLFGAHFAYRLRRAGL
ncbi:MAG TPA: MFS transporter [Burkholderiales bacterium]|nr:MFS transporter [Burkholderiales bacterium]